MTATEHARGDGDGSSQRSISAAGPVDAHVGNRIRLRRTLLGLSQEKLAEALGLTFQQVQKYERGANRVSASRLHELSRVLDVPIGFFFDDMGDSSNTKAAPAPSTTMGFAETQSAFGGPSPGAKAAPPRLFDLPPDEAALFSKRETVDLVRSYYRIADPSVRKRMLDLIRSLGPAGPE